LEVLVIPAIDKKPTLSPSRLEMLSKCGMQYYFRYIEGRVVPPGVAMVVGTATHKSVERNLGNKIQTGQLLPQDAVVEAGIDAIKNHWEGEPPALDDDEKEIGEKAVKGRAIDTVATLAKLHHQEFAPKIQPTHVERYFRLELKGFPFDLDGFMDIQEATTVRDTKTSAKSPSGDEADYSVQLSAYALAVKTVDGKLPTSVHLDYLVKTKEPKAVPVSSTRDEEQLRSLLLRVERAATVVEKGAFYPTSPDNWVCSKKWCGYWDSVCPFGRRSRKQA
jgi:RecB family exonuclease